MCYPRVGISFFICFTRGNKSIANFLPLVSLLHWKLPQSWYSSTGSQKPVPSVHTMVPPPRSAYPPSFPQTQQVCCTSPRQSASPGKPVYTKGMSPGAGTLSQPARAGSSCALGHSPAETFVLGHVWKVIQPRHVNVSVKDTIDSYGQYTPRILGLWVGWFFFKVMSLSPI